MTREIRLQHLFCAEINPSRSVVSTFSPHRSPFRRDRRLRGAVRIATGTRLGQWKSCTFTGHIVGVLLKRSVHSCGFTGPRLLPFGGPKPLVEWIRMDIRSPSSPDSWTPLARPHQLRATRPLREAPEGHRPNAESLHPPPKGPAPRQFPRKDDAAVLCRSFVWAEHLQTESKRKL